MTETFWMQNQIRPLFRPITTRKMEYTCVIEFQNCTTTTLSKPSPPPGGGRAFISELKIELHHKGDAEKTVGLVVDLCLTNQRPIITPQPTIQSIQVYYTHLCLVVVYDDVSNKYLS